MFVCFVNTFNSVEKVKYLQLIPLFWRHLLTRISIFDTKCVNLYYYAFSFILIFSMS